MATIKQGEKKHLEEHSKEKVKFYKKYLDLYLTVLMSAKYTKAINIYDIFCGVGVYLKDNSKGSPIVAMESILEKLETGNNAKVINLLINDGDLQRVETASNYIKKYYDNKFNFTYHNLLSDEIFKLTINQINEADPNTNHLIFIDPHGYKDIYKKDILSMMEAGKSEILIFLPVHRMYSFSKTAMKIDSNSSFTPLKRLMIEFGLKSSAETPKEYITYIEKAFSFDNKFLTTSYILQADSNNYYALFFITKNFRGLEKAVETKWKLDTLCGKGFEQKKAPSLFDDLNKKEKKEDCLGDLSRMLKNYLLKKRTNINLYEFTLKKGFLIKHTNEILKILQSSNRLQFDREIRKNSFYINYDNYRDEDIRYEVKIIE